MSNDVNSSVSFQSDKSEKSNNSNKENVKKKEILQKIKNYYKTLFSDYKNFLQKITYSSAETEPSCDLSTMVKKSIRKSINSNPDSTDKNLYQNIKKIKKDLYFITENFNQKILVIDGENILKSYKFQQLIKLHLTEEQTNYYFEHWNWGSSNGFIQPMTSLNLNITDKIFLINLLVSNYLNLYNCVIILSGKTSLDFEIKSSLTSDNKTLIVPVIYDKTDIREQDDHLLLYIYYHLNKRNFDCWVISGDKFKWFKNSESKTQDYTYIKNFRIEYNFDDLKYNINIVPAYTNDLIIFSEIKYQIGYYYFPFINHIEHFVDFNLETTNLKEIINNYILEKNYSSILSLIIKIYLILIKLNNKSGSEQEIKYFTDTIIHLIKKLIHSHTETFNQIIKIFDLINSTNKKVFDNLDNLTFIKEMIFTIENDDNNNNMDKLKNFLNCMNNYISLMEIYLIIKSISFLLHGEKPIIKIAKLFSKLTLIFDLIDNSISKIRKLSSKTTELNKMFLFVLSNHIFMKKNGFCKKDF